jgi:tripartite-type tricarboxylate transporter receptor subunit TctC
MDKRSFAKAAVCLTGSALLPKFNYAQDRLPSIVKIIVPFSAGGSNDVFARALAEQLTQELKTSFIVENKPGAGGSMGSAQVAKATPDGATLLLTSNSIVTNNAVLEKPAFDPVNSFKHIAILNKGPSLLIVSGKSKYKDLPSFIAAAKNGEISNYGSAGIGSSAHMATEMLNYGLKTDILHVPYKGISNVVVDIIGNNIDMVITTSASVSGQLKFGQLKALGVTSPEASPFFKDLKPISDYVKGYDVEAWWGVFAPAQTPQWMAEMLNKKINEISQKKQMTELFKNEGTTPANIDLEQIKNFVLAEQKKWKFIAKSRQIKPL